MELSTSAAFSSGSFAESPLILANNYDNIGNLTREYVAEILNHSENETMVMPVEDYPDFTQIPAVYFLFIVLYILVMVLALFGNFMVCYVVFSNRKMHTVVNYYIVNLAVCDFMVGAFVLPVKLLEMAAPAEWGALNNQLCTAMTYLQTIFVFASVLTLVATCLERYVAILHPLESRMYQSKKRAKRILLVVWLTPCMAALPFVYSNASAQAHTLSSQYGSIHRLSCMLDFSPEFRVGYYTFLFFVFYLVPLTFIGGTCFRIAQCLVRGISFQRQGSVRRQEANRRKVAKMIMIVVVAFAVSWTPYFLVTMITQYHTHNYFETHNYFFTMMCINLFAFINSCVNPFIYAAMSSRFRNGFKRFLRIITCSLNPRKHPISKNKRPRSAGRFSCSYNRQNLLYANEYSQNNSENSASQSDSGSLQQSTAAIHIDSVRSLRSLVSCLSFRKSTGEGGKPNGVCLTGNGKFVFSELATIPGSPVGGMGSVEKKLKEVVDPEDNGTVEESLSSKPVRDTQDVDEKVRGEDPVDVPDTVEPTEDAPEILASQTLYHASIKDSGYSQRDISESEEITISRNESPTMEDYFEKKCVINRQSVILIPESFSLTAVDHCHTHARRHSIERTILYFHSSSDKRVHRSASAPSSLLQCALKAILPSSEVRIDNL